MQKKLPKRTARDIINSLSDENIQRLSDDEWEQLFDDLKAEGVCFVPSNKDNKAVPSEPLKRLYSNYRLDKDFVDKEIYKALDLVEKLVEDPDIYAGIKRWDNLDEKGKVDVIQRTVAIFADHYNMGLVQTEPFDGSKDEKHKDTIAYVNFKNKMSQEIHINKSEKMLKKPFSEWMGTVPHELTHRKDIADKKSEKHELFMKNLGAYCSSENGYYPYCNQPLEKHANLVGHVISTSLNRLIDADKIKSVNPFDKEAAEEEYRKAVETGNGVNVGVGVYESRDPYRHFYKAKFHTDKIVSGQAAKINERGKDHERLAIEHYGKAFFLSEFIDSELAEKSVKRLQSFACGFIEAKGKEKYTQKVARKVLQNIAENATDEKLKWTAVQGIYEADNPKPRLVMVRNGKRYITVPPDKGKRNSALFYDKAAGRVYRTG